MPEEEPRTSLDARFTGVNAYFFGANQLDIVFPNATRMGQSPSIGQLLPHFPTIWSFNGSGQLVFLEYFPWKRLEIEAKNKGGGTVPFQATPPVSNPAKALQIPKQSVKDEPDTSKISGQVRIHSGVVDTSVAGCAGLLSWTQGNLDMAGLLHEVGLTISSAASIDFQLVDLFKKSNSQAWTLPSHVTRTVFIGNVCAQDVLGWPTNSIAKVDEDFAWLDLLAGLGSGLPKPKIASGTCLFNQTDKIDSTLATRVSDHFRSSVGGGACGCECVGAQVSLV